MTQTSSPRQKIQRRPVHGVLLLDKPIGLSSNQALQKAKWLMRAEKAGHTGTLDPLATGVLPLCFGAATKFSQMQLEADKTYEAVLLLGQKTTTADAEGDVIETRDVPEITAVLLEKLTAQFSGPQAQIPPMYSALKKDGKALYEYARAGEIIEREPRHIVIHAMQMSVAHDDRAPAAHRQRLARRPDQVLQLGQRQPDHLQRQRGEHQRVGDLYRSRDDAVRECHAGIGRDSVACRLRDVLPGVAIDAAF